jgi:hypothetical protein
VKIAVPVGLLLDLLGYLERRVGSRRPFDRELSRLLDRLHEVIEADR